MDISVVLCTYNRCQDLSRALEGLARSKLAGSITWEVLIVDNNSTDKTRSIAEEFCQAYAPHFVYVFEPAQGKSHALNTGVRQAQGDVIAFTDDDAVVDPSWLENLTAPLRGDRYAGVGGRTFPYGSFSPPCWLPHDSPDGRAPLALFDRGASEMELFEAPFGNNMAFRKEVFGKYGEFRTDLGPQPGSGNPQKGEDSELGERLLAAGERICYEPSAVVYHRVFPHKVQKEYILSWWADKARSDIRIAGVPRDTRWFLAGIPLYLFRRILRWTFKWVISVRPDQRFSCKIRVWSLAATILACHSRCRGLPK